MANKLDAVHTSVSSAECNSLVENEHVRRRATKPERQPTTKFTMHITTSYETLRRQSATVLCHWLSTLHSARERAYERGHCAINFADE